MDNDPNPGLPPLDQLKAELEASEVEARAGLTIPLSKVLDRMRAGLARMRSKQADRAAAKA